MIAIVFCMYYFSFLSAKVNMERKKGHDKFVQKSDNFDMIDSQLVMNCIMLRHS